MWLNWDKKDGTITRNTTIPYAHIFSYPRVVIGHVGIDTWPATCTAPLVAPGDDTAKICFIAQNLLACQWTSGVTLASVAFLPSGANHVLRDFYRATGIKLPAVFPLYKCNQCNLVLIEGGPVRQAGFPPTADFGFFCCNFHVKRLEELIKCAIIIEKL